MSVVREAHNVLTTLITNVVKDVGMVVQKSLIIIESTHTIQQEIKRCWIILPDASTVYMQQDTRG